MSYKKKSSIFLVAIIATLCIGTTAFAANALNIGSISDDSIILGLDAGREPDGTNKISFDMGETWIPQNEDVHSDYSSIEYWTYEEYKTYVETVEQDLTEMLAAGETNLTTEDIRAWREESAQILSHIADGGKIAKNTIDEDSQFMISDSNNVASITE